MLPIEPPFRLKTDAVGGRIGDEPEDFRVSEIPAYAFDGEGEHLYLRVRKRDATTRDAERAIASHFSMSPRDVGYAGMKDRNAVTEQWFSVAHPADVAPTRLNERVEIVAVARHRNKLRRGHLSGNAFEITLRDVDASDEKIDDIADAVRRCGIYNAFGHQRFGRDGDNLRRALEWAEDGGRASHFKRQFFTSVIQSEVFNRYLVTRAGEQSEPRVLVGDVLRLDGNRSVFVSEDAEVDERRRIEGDVHLTGPIFGPKAKRSAGVPGQWEQAAFDALGLSDDARHRLAKHGAGTRRDLLLDGSSLSWERVGAEAVKLSFVLPSGSYATQLVREFIRTPWLDRMRTSNGEEFLDED